jgi:hypothetical protein
MKKRGVATLLGGSTAHPDPKMNGLGLLIELPNDASFAQQNLERQENRELIDSVIAKLHGTKLPLAFTLGTRRSKPASVPSDISDGDRRTADETSSGTTLLSEDSDNRSQEPALFDVDLPIASPRTAIPDTPVLDTSTPDAPNVSNTPRASDASAVAASSATSDNDVPKPDDSFSFANIVSASFNAPVTVREIDEFEEADEVAEAGRASNLPESFETSDPPVSSTPNEPGEYNVWD